MKNFYLYLLYSIFITVSNNVFAVPPLGVCQEKAIANQAMILDTTTRDTYINSMGNIVQALRDTLSQTFPNQPENICHTLDLQVTNGQVDHNLTLYIDQQDAYLWAVRADNHYYGDRSFLQFQQQVNKTDINISYNNRSNFWLGKRSPYNLINDINNAEMVFDAITLIEASKMPAIEATYAAVSYSSDIPYNIGSLLHTMKINYAKQVRCFLTHQQRNSNQQYQHLLNLKAAKEQTDGIDPAVDAALTLTNWYGNTSEDDFRAKMRYINPSYIQQNARNQDMPQSDQCMRQPH